MEPLFVGMVDKLRQARQSVQNELEPLIEVQAANREALLDILRSARTFAAEGDSVFQLMFERGADRALMDETEDLIDFFQRAAKQIEAMLEAEHR